jgi:hypothetical protein
MRKHTNSRQTAEVPEPSCLRRAAGALRPADHVSRCHWPRGTAICCAPARSTPAPPTSPRRPGLPCMHGRRPVASKMLSYRFITSIKFLSPGIKPSVRVSSDLTVLLFCHVIIGSPYKKRHPIVALPLLLLPDTNLRKYDFATLGMTSVPARWPKARDFKKIMPLFTSIDEDYKLL